MNIFETAGWITLTALCLSQLGIIHKPSDWTPETLRNAALEHLDAHPKPEQINAGDGYRITGETE